MDTYLIVAQSITQAQQMQRTLSRAGIPCRIVRGHRAITPQGCGYTVQLPEAALWAAVRALDQEGFRPYRVYAYNTRRYQEVTV